MIYKIQNDETITAASAAEFVTKLREGSKMDWDCTDAQYMKNFAKRQKMWNGYELDTSSPEAFVKGLIEAKFILEMIEN